MTILTITSLPPVIQHHLPPPPYPVKFSTTRLIGISTISSVCAAPTTKEHIPPVIPLQNRTYIVFLYCALVLSWFSTNHNNIHAISQNDDFLVNFFSNSKNLTLIFRVLGARTYPSSSPTGAHNWLLFFLVEEINYF